MCDRRLALRRTLPACAFPAIRNTVDPRYNAAIREFDVSLTVAHVTPFISLLAGILILVIPVLLNYIVAIYLIVAGVVSLNETPHFLT
jgi:hypothetical protein